VYKTVTESDERLSRDDNLAAKVEVRKLHEGGRTKVAARMAIQTFPHS
jgi:hypothetical protein